MKKVLLVLCIILALSFAVVGCSKTEGGSGSTAKTQDQLVIGISSEPVSLDEHQISDYNSDRVACEIYDTLIRFSDTSLDVSALEPGLAESWEISEDGKTYTLKLRSGVKFHDGTDFNADAVVYNYERMMDPKHPAYDTGEYAYSAVLFGEVAKCEAPDASTVVFTLKQAYAPFILSCAMTQFSIESPAAIEKFGKDYTQNPVGTGPYKFVEWSAGTEVILERNDDYWGDKATIAKLVYRFVKDDNTRLNELESGTIDVSVDVLPDSIASLKDNPDFAIMEQPSMHTWYLSLNTQAPPFDKKEIRQAFYYAIDRNAIVDNILQGTGVVAENLLPPLSPSYSTDVPKYENNVDKAKKLLASVGASDLTVDLWVPEGGSGMQQPDAMATAIQSDLKKAGVTINIKKLEWGAYLEKMFSGKPKDQEMLIGQMSWITDNGDPDNFLYALCSNTQWPPQFNSSYYSNKDFEKLVTEARFSTDQAERDTLYAQAQKILMEDVPYLPIDHAIETIATKSSVTGFVQHPRGFYRTTKVTFK